MKTVVLVVALSFLCGCDYCQPAQPDQISISIGESKASVLSKISEKVYSMDSSDGVDHYRYADTFTDCSIGDPTHCEPSRELDFKDGKLVGFARLWDNVSAQ